MGFYCRYCRGEHCQYVIHHTILLYHWNGWCELGEGILVVLDDRMVRVIGYCGRVEGVPN